MFDGRCKVALAADSLEAALRAAFAGIGVAGVVAAACFASGVVACAGTCSCTRCDGALAGVAVASAGAKVRAGEPAGRIHRVWEPAHAPDTIFYGCDGILFARRQPGRVWPGNCCVVVASPV